MAWGDADGKTLYLCARSGLYRIRLNIAGVRPETVNTALADRVFSRREKLYVEALHKKSVFGFIGNIM
jgi:hypothetical protein